MEATNDTFEGRGYVHTLGQNPIHDPIGDFQSTADFSWTKTASGEVQAVANGEETTYGGTLTRQTVAVGAANATGNHWVDFDTTRVSGNFGNLDSESYDGHRNEMNSDQFSSTVTDTSVFTAGNPTPATTRTTLQTANGTETFTDDNRWASVNGGVTNVMAELYTTTDTYTGTDGPGFSGAKYYGSVGYDSVARPGPDRPLWAMGGGGGMGGEDPGDQGGLVGVQAVPAHRSAPATLPCLQNRASRITYAQVPAQGGVFSCKFT